jgi:hypothetical protein
MISRLKKYVRDLPFMRRRRLLLRICEAASSEKYHRDRAQEFREEKMSLIAEYDDIGKKKRAADDGDICGSLRR